MWVGTKIETNTSRPCDSLLHSISILPQKQPFFYSVKIGKDSSRGDGDEACHPKSAAQLSIQKDCHAVAREAFGIALGTSAHGRASILPAFEPL